MPSLLDNKLSSISACHTPGGRKWLASAMCPPDKSHNPGFPDTSTTNTVRSNIELNYEIDPPQAIGSSDEVWDCIVLQNPNDAYWPVLTLSYLQGHEQAVVNFFKSAGNMVVHDSYYTLDNINSSSRTLEGMLKNMVTINSTYKSKLCRGNNLDLHLNDEGKRESDKTKRVVHVKSHFDTYFPEPKDVTSWRPTGASNECLLSAAEAHRQGVVYGSHGPPPIKSYEKAKYSIPHDALYMDTLQKVEKVHLVDIVNSTTQIITFEELLAFRDPRTKEPLEYGGVLPFDMSSFISPHIIRDDSLAGQYSWDTSDKQIQWSGFHKHGVMLKRIGKHSTGEFEKPGHYLETIIVPPIGQQTIGDVLHSNTFYDFISYEDFAGWNTHINYGQPGLFHNGSQINNGTRKVIYGTKSADSRYYAWFTLNQNDPDASYGGGADAPDTPVPKYTTVLPLKLTDMQVYSDMEQHMATHGSYQVSRLDGPNGFASSLELSSLLDNNTRVATDGVNSRHSCASFQYILPGKADNADADALPPISYIRSDIKDFVKGHYEWYADRHFIIYDRTATYNNYSNYYTDRCPVPVCTAETLPSANSWTTTVAKFIGLSGLSRLICKACRNIEFIPSVDGDFAALSSRKAQIDTAAIGQGLSLLNSMPPLMRPNQKDPNIFMRGSWGQAKSYANPLALEPRSNTAPRR